MSAPNTNIERQRRRHRGPLVGITLAVIFVLALFAMWLTGQIGSTSAPASAPAPGAAVPLQTAPAPAPAAPQTPAAPAN